MARLILLLAVAAGLYLLFSWLSRQPPRVYWQFLAVLLALVLLVLVLTGRAHWLTAVFAALLPFVRTLTVQSRYLRMTLDHDSGDIDGEVLDGRFKGARLGRMELDALLQLLRECRHDEESVALLQAYLDRVYADSWRQRAGDDGERQATRAPGEMTPDEALQVLGLQRGASEAEIVEADAKAAPGPRRLGLPRGLDQPGQGYAAVGLTPGIFARRIAAWDFPGGPL